jgi:hypothetical protein
MIHQSGRVGSGVVPVSQLVFKINEEHRVRPQDKKSGTKPAYAHDACNACTYDLFLFQRNSRVLFANFFGNIKHFITYGNIS